MVIEESKERKANTPLKGNVTANPQSDKKKPKPVQATKTSPSKASKSPKKSPTKSKKEVETGGVKKPVVPAKKEQIEDHKFAPPDQEIRRVKAYVDDP